ncbi:hypothetical protein H8356DRAFT_1434629 [Neocallimastix lanati (nom. inval.)]|nr:hypothetical protein H8356DRAFT_1434629 [Neocallimastix sp. JGI-2020a]
MLKKQYDRPAGLAQPMKIIILFIEDLRIRNGIRRINNSIMKKKKFLEALLLKSYESNIPYIVNLMNYLTNTLTVVKPLLLDLLIYLIQLVVIGSSHNESMKFESPENIFLV